MRVRLNPSASGIAVGIGRDVPLDNVCRVVDNRGAREADRSRNCGKEVVLGQDALSIEVPESPSQLYACRRSIERAGRDDDALHIVVELDAVRPRSAEEALLKLGAEGGRVAIAQLDDIQCPRRDDEEAIREGDGLVAAVDVEAVGRRGVRAVEVAAEERQRLDAVRSVPGDLQRRAVGGTRVLRRHGLELLIGDEGNCTADHLRRVDEDRPLLGDKLDLTDVRTVRLIVEQSGVSEHGIRCASRIMLRLHGTVVPVVAPRQGGEVGAPFDPRIAGCISDGLNPEIADDAEAGSHVRARHVVVPDAALPAVTLLVCAGRTTIDPDRVHIELARGGDVDRHARAVAASAGEGDS